MLPRLQAAAWEDEPHSITEQKIFTNGHVIVTGSFTRRGKKKRADYLLRYTRDFMIVVVEAKAEYLTPARRLRLVNTDLCRCFL